MFSNIKINEYMEFELSGVFWVNVVTKNIVLGSLGTHFMHLRVKSDSTKIESKIINIY